MRKLNLRKLKIDFYLITPMFEVLSPNFRKKATSIAVSISS